ncbi:hypothetical protein SESBI_29032 [Sesbania bispinosa]|nr:hypothetical protein SESBI_29032 [Sesbania bispinosa]
MEPEEDTLTMPPFWVPNTNPRRRLRRSYSLLLTSTSLFILLLITVLVFSLVVVPTLRSFASNIFRPQAVKHSWDYLNLLLVLFAVICGFLTKNDNNEAQTPRFDRHRRSFSNPETPPPWYDYPNRSFNRLRSFGSHPDLRDHSSWVAADERFRFYDDTHLLLCHRRREPDAEEVEKEQGIENMEKGKKKRGSATKEFLTSLTGKKKKQRQRSVENFESILKSEPFPLASQPPPPPPPPPPSVFNNLFSSKKSKHKKRNFVAVATHKPRPDVDTKAHNFIESFRAGLRMAKMNSMKEKQGIGRSNLGPSPNR